MRKFINFGCIVFMALLGGFIGFDPHSPNQTANASPTPMIRWVDVPKPTISIDLRSESQSEEVKPQVITKTVEVPVPVEKVVPVYVDDGISRSRLYNRLYPIENELPKINVDRD